MLQIGCSNYRRNLSLIRNKTSGSNESESNVCDEKEERKKTGYIWCETTTCQNYKYEYKFSHIITSIFSLTDVIATAAALGIGTKGSSGKENDVSTGASMAFGKSRDAIKINKIRVGAQKAGANRERTGMLMTVACLPIRPFLQNVRFCDRNLCLRYNGRNPLVI